MWRKDPGCPVGGVRRLGEGGFRPTGELQIKNLGGRTEVGGGGGMPRVSVCLHQCVCQFRECMFVSV